MRIADVLLTGNSKDKMADYVERKSHKMQNCGLQILAGIL